MYANNNIAVNGVGGGDIIKASIGGATVSIYDLNGGDNTVTASGGNNRVTINDTAGHDTISLAGNSNSVTLSGAGGSDTVVLANAPIGSKNYDTISGFGSGSDVIGFSTSTGLTTYAGELTWAGKLGPDSVGWLNEGGNTLIFANTATTGPAANVSNLNPVAELKGDVTLAAHNFKFGVA